MLRQQELRSTAIRFVPLAIREYLRNRGKLEIARQMANHESTRTTRLYDRRNDQLSMGFLRSLWPSELKKSAFVWRWEQAVRISPGL